MLGSQSEEMVILVDESDNEIGVAEKMSAHLKGQLHRAISVFLFNDQRQMLVQQRALTKYHSGGLWSNSCCTHPRPQEAVMDAAKRRLWEEMGIECDLEKAFVFTYNVDLGGGLAEHEYDHIFVGRFNAEPNLNAEEVGAWKWIDTDALLQDVEKHPERYTAWFRVLLAPFSKHPQFPKSVVQTAYTAPA